MRQFIQGRDLSGRSRRSGDARISGRSFDILGAPPPSADPPDQPSHPSAPRHDTLFRAIEDTADSVVITDRDGVIQYVNPAFEKMSGFARHEAVGRTPRILRSGMLTRAFYQRLWDTILSGQTFRSVMTNRRKDGTLYDEDQTITPVRNEAAIITHFVSTGRDVTEHKRMHQALRRLNRQFEREAARIAGVLHDEAGQFLASAHITLAEICETVPADVCRRLLGVRKHLDDVESRLRQISHEIHPRVVEDLGLGEAVGFLVATFSKRTGIGVTIHSTITLRYSLQIETLLYRLVQEALMNISRHARATRAVVRLTADAHLVSCSIEDNGVGFDATEFPGPRPEGLGLRLIQDRLDAVGGRLEIVSAPGQGTTLHAIVPLQV